MLRTSCTISPSLLRQRALSESIPLTQAPPFSIFVSLTESCKLYFSTSSMPSDEISSPRRMVSLASSTLLPVDTSVVLSSRSSSPDMPESARMGAALVTVSSISITASSRSCPLAAGRIESAFSTASASVFIPTFTPGASASQLKSDVDTKENTPPSSPTATEVTSILPVTASLFSSARQDITSTEAE